MSSRDSPPTRFIVKLGLTSQRDFVEIIPDASDRTVETGPTAEWTIDVVPPAFRGEALVAIGPALTWTSRYWFRQNSHLYE